MKEFIKILSLILFTALMLIKVSSLHVYTHVDDESELIENCDACELAIESQQTFHLETPTFSFSNRLLPVLKQVRNYKPEKETLQTVRLYFFSRPPPSLS